MGLFSRTVKPAGRYTDEVQGRRYHGSAPRRSVLKHGGQAGRWRMFGAQEENQPGRGRNGRSPGRGR